VGVKLDAFRDLCMKNKKKTRKILNVACKAVSRYKTLSRSLPFSSVGV
jgi:hypothetical protein